MTDYPHCLDHSAHEHLLREHDTRLSKHGAEIDSLKECIVRLTTLQEESARWHSEADNRLKAVEAVPGSRWDKAVSTAITSLISAMIGALAAFIGLHGGM